jgi:hypothetical protein
MESQHLTQTELNRVVELRNAVSQILTQLGQIDLEKFLTDQRMNQLNETKQSLYEQYNNLQKQESELIIELNAKYGVGTVDIENGKFTPSAI